MVAGGEGAVVESRSAEECHLAAAVLWCVQSPRKLINWVEPPLTQRSKDAADVWLRGHSGKLRRGAGYLLACVGSIDSVYLSIGSWGERLCSPQGGERVCRCEKLGK